MTGARPQIQTEQHGRASALTTAVLPQPGRRPIRARRRNDSQPHSPACWATPTLSCPSPITVPSSIAALSSPAGTIQLTCHQTCPRPHPANLRRPHNA